MKSKGRYELNSKFKPNLTLEIYDKLAKSYDKRNLMMELWITKARSVFSVLKGDILEIGIGTGNNLIQYNSAARIVGFDWSSQMISQAQLKVKEYALNNIREFVIGDIQRLSDYFKPKSFDYITSSCVFCSVPNPILGFKEVSKVLKDSGKLFQIEHGLSESKFINLGLNLLDPFTSKRFGFHLNRNHFKNLERSGFEIIHQLKIDPTGIFRLLVSKKSIKFNNQGI
jgi:ubiquinone/menaquinone biosynthesis C-methylase UbiE